MAEKYDSDIFSNSAANLNDSDDGELDKYSSNGIVGNFDLSKAAQWLPLNNSNLMDPGISSPLNTYKPEYLHYQPKQWYERLSYNAGFAYLFGIGSGGLYGVINGFSTSPSSKMRIRINSVLNKSGRFGSRFGNSLGAIAMIYSCLEEFTYRARIEDYIPQVEEDIVNPVIAAGLTGILYKSTQGPKTMVLAGLLGSIAAASLRTASGFKSAQIGGKQAGLFF